MNPRKDVTDDQLTSIFNLATDWAHYNGNCWLVWTSSDAKKWNERLRPFVNPGGSVLIVRVDLSDYFGFVNQVIWPWLDKYKNQISAQ